MLLLIIIYNNIYYYIYILYILYILHMYISNERKGTKLIKVYNLYT